MVRFAWLALLVAACATDDRPRTIDYVTEAILAPSCGTAECHSTFSAQLTDIFDTVKGARSSIVRNALVRLDSVPQYDPDAPGNATLIIWITRTDPFGLGIGRMPQDAPLPNEDVELLQRWISEGASGAQCDPDANGGMACNDKALFTCNSDWSFGDEVMECANNCSAGTCQ